MENPKEFDTRVLHFKSMFFPQQYLTKSCNHKIRWTAFTLGKDITTAEIKAKERAAKFKSVYLGVVEDEKA